MCVWPCQALLMEVMAPHLRAGRYDEAVEAAVREMRAMLEAGPESYKVSG